MDLLIVKAGPVPSKPQSPGGSLGAEVDCSYASCATRGIQ
jgi:hypothetical protein